MGNTKNNEVLAPEAAVSGQIIGPESESDLLGCQDESEVLEGLLVEYAVTSKGGLRLRQEPSLDSPILVVLPLGAGVFSDGVSAPEGWLHVRTGRLEGYMLARHLEELPMPELTCADG